ncbi:hypothetical protein [Flavilitoribacter nigricans]|uniref:Tetratricopeptide repeat protein n=1 Tax=Flavilitoribacter nigricans (strain ATCC 23147 / DSM 23189 / NBRC 102662 / NCIMB 1420 / SS-2) TaxID=1122177 RepID=A0A2D0N0M8_FLAN2|nr:hypothetical protein [Flavilitoribacter nigricans]PHN02045.1 hypothetical protein CRP01_33965 [Flavilitoribacter nigricans DSM 23189 = NBRC 102662]
MLRSLIPCFLLSLLTLGFAGAQTYIPTDYSNRKISFKTTGETSTPSKIRMYLAPTSENEGGGLTYVMEEIRATAKKLERQKVKRKRQKKAIELIRDEVENRYLRSYRGLADFSSLFKARQYNELTAAALISMLLDELAMEHELYWEQGQAKITLEDGTLLPIDQWGKNRPARRAREEEQSHLLNVLDALQLGPENSLHRAMVTPYSAGAEKRSLLPAELTGMLFYRRALDFYAKGKATAAVEALERARTYYTDPKLDLVRYAILYRQASESGQDSTMVEPLFELYSLHPRSEISLELVRRFAQLAEYYLLRENDQPSFERLYDQYRRVFSGQLAILQQLKEIYFIEMAQFHAGRHEPHQVTTYLDSLSHYRPNDPKIQAILTPLLLRSLCNQKDPDEGLKIVEEYRRDYPFLRNEALFLDMELCYRAERTRRAFDGEDEARGRECLEAFEQVLAQAGLTPRSESWITTAYTSASAYYFRNADYVNARWLIQRALALIPDDQFLLHRKDVLQNY